MQFIKLYDYGIKNNYVCNATESSIKATKIWSVASDWEYFIFSLLLPKHTVSRLTGNRLKGKY